MHAEQDRPVNQERQVDSEEFERYSKKIDELTRQGKINELIEELHNPARLSTLTVRQLAARSLGRLRAAEAARPLAATLSDADENVRFRAAQALGLVGSSDRVVLDSLARAAEHDPSELVRAFAIQSLGQIGDPRVVPHVVQFLSAERPRIRFSAMYALFLIDDPHAHATAQAQFELERGIRSGWSRRRLMRAVRKFERSRRRWSTG
jgi:HEAT repeat protein